MSNPMATHGAFSWMELHSGDSGKARSFYAELLGWNVEDMPMPDGSYPVIKNGEESLGGFSPMPADKPHWLPYITVDDVDKRVEKAKSLGAAVLSEPVSVPGVGRMATLSDSVGGVFAMITYESQQA